MYPHPTKEQLNWVIEVPAEYLISPGMGIPQPGTCSSAAPHHCEEIFLYT